MEKVVVRQLESKGPAVLGCVFLFFLAACTHTPGPEETVKQAYTWYVQTRQAGINPFEAKRDELARYLTAAFLASLARSELPQSIETEELAGAALEITEMKVSSKRATGRAKLSSRFIGLHFFLLRLERENGRWKIDDVKVMEPPDN